METEAIYGDRVWNVEAQEALMSGGSYCSYCYGWRFCKRKKRRVATILSKCEYSSGSPAEGGVSVQGGSGGW